MRLLGARRLATTATIATATPPPAQNLIEQIVQKYARDLPSSTYLVRQGDFVSIEPRHVMTHDNTGAVLGKFASIGAQRIFRAGQPVVALDHDVQNTSAANTAKYARIGEFARRHSLAFFGAGVGIGHQTMVEQAFAWPRSLAVASDSHANMYGGVGCLGSPVVRSDAAAIWATGRTWWQIPPVAKLVFTGALPAHCSGKDVIVALCGLLNNDQVLNHAIEFAGPGIASLSVDNRLTIANMSTEWGALAAVFPVDHKTIAYYRARIAALDDPSHPRINNAAVDALERETALLGPVPETAKYSKIITFDLSSLSPYVSGPNSVKIATPLNVLVDKNITVHKAYLLSCVNSRQSDIKAAAKVMKGHKIAPHVEFYLAAASQTVQREAEESGDWDILVNAGAIVLPAGCGPCIGLGAGLLKDGEVGISATNRNFKGRMGSRSAQAYLASPAVVAASAIAGKIAFPESLPTTSTKHIAPIFSVEIPQKESLALKTKTQSTQSVAAPTIPGFPQTLTGEILFLPTDNLDTDGIYPGAFTYQDDIVPAEMAKIAMRNYDPSFTAKLQRNDVVVSGYNFGTGSSREQAATCLLHAGVPLILAGSLSETYKRNAINNGLLCLEAPELVEDLSREFGGRRNVAGGSSVAADQELTIRTGLTIEVEYGAGIVRVFSKNDGDNNTWKSKEYSVPVVGKAAQELIVLGGLENWVKAKIAENNV